MMKPKVRFADMVDYDVTSSDSLLSPPSSSKHTSLIKDDTDLKGGRRSSRISDQKSKSETIPSSSKSCLKENTTSRMTGQAHKSKLQVVEEAQVGNKKLKYTLEFDSNKIPKRGSADMYKAIFKAAKTCGTITAEDRSQIDRDIQKFWGKPLPCPTEKKKNKREKRPRVTLKILGVPKEVQPKTSRKSSQDTIDLLEVDDFCDEVDKNKKAETQVHSPVRASSSVHPTTRSEEQKGTRKPLNRSKQSSVTNKKQPVDVIDLISSDEEEEEISDPGRMICFTVSFQSQKYNLFSYESKTSKELRDNLAKKANVEAAYIDMYLGEDTKLDDNKTLLEYSIPLSCEIDAFYTQKSNLELYKAGSSAVMRLKCQTSDRRGRETMYVYVKKTGKMKEVRDDYAEKMKMDPSKLKLSFDGEILCLESTPEQCDLEGEECLDVLVAR